MHYIYGFNRRLAIILALCILLPCFMAFCGVAVFHTKDIYKQLDNDVQHGIDLVNENALEYMVKISQQTHFIMSYKEINDVLSETESVRISPEVLEHNREINNVIDALLTESNATDIRIYTTNKIADYLSCVEYIDDDRLSIISDDGEWVLKNDVLGYRLFFYRKYCTRPEFYNVIEIAVPFRKIIESFKEIEYNNTYINIGDMYFTYESGRYREKEIPKKPFYTVTGNIEPFDIPVTVYVDRTHISRPIAEMWILLTLIFALVVLAIVLISNIISNNILKGISDIVNGILLNNMSLIKDSAYKSRETDIIRDYLIELQNKLTEENEIKLKFEADLLAERISPHFLYNNLSALKNSCIDEKSKKTVDRLVRYYRNVFQKGSQSTTVQKEIDNGVEYLQLIQFSYDTEFRIDVQIDEKCAGMKVPSNILQPVLENAFIHGINNNEREDSAVIIRAFMDEGDLCVSVTDTGGRFDRNRYNDRLNQQGKRHALTMIVERMRLYYNDERYTVTIDGDENITQVVFRFGNLD